MIETPILLRFYEWRDGQMDGTTDFLRDKFMDGITNGWTDGRMDGLTNRYSKTGCHSAYLFVMN